MRQGFVLISLLLVGWMSMEAHAVAPVEQITTVYFPLVSAMPVMNPKVLLLRQGAEHALIDVSVLVEIKGISVCIQRAISPPASLEAWAACTYGHTWTNHADSRDFQFNVTDVEGNVPYFVSVALQSPDVRETSVQVYMTVEICSGTFTRALHHPHQCVPTVSMPSDDPMSFSVPANTPLSNHYFSVSTPNSNAKEIVTGMDISIYMPIDVQWSFYASVNMPVSFEGADFFITSNSVLNGKPFHITAPSPGLWFLALIINNNPEGNPAFNGTIKRTIERANPIELGPEIKTDNRLVAGPEVNKPNTLQLFHLFSPDGYLYVSLSVMYPEKLPQGQPLPYKMFVAVNAVPGSFNNSIDPRGSDIFADWTGCSLLPALCERVMVVNSAAVYQTPVTYVIGVLPVGNHSGTQFVLWRNSPCPYCERGVCQTSAQAYGSCKCPSGWLQIDCAKWGERGLTPQMIVIIAVMAFFAIFGIGVLIWVLYSKRARLFPSKFGPLSNGYETINDNEKQYSYYQNSHDTHSASLSASSHTTAPPHKRPLVDEEASPEPSDNE